MSNLNNKSLILNKLKESFNFVKDSDFAAFLGIKPQTLSSWHTRNTFDIELLYAKCVNINPEFLFTGEGDVFKNKLLLNEPNNIYKLKTDNSISDHQLIPLYGLEATAGIVSLFKDANSYEPIDTLSIPNLPKCDGAVYVTGDSMYPLLKSGDIIIYKQVNDIENNIYFGEMYMLSIRSNGDDYVTVKFIQKSEKGEKYVKLVSQNQHHQPKDILISKIAALALIKASVRINSM